MYKITILGTGGWGMALAIAIAKNGHHVNLWSPFEEEVTLLKKNRTNEKLLKDIFLPEEINITDDLSVVEGDTLTIIATPSNAVSEVSEKLAKYNNVGIIVNVAKGFEQGTLKRLSQVISEKLCNSSVVVLTGPSHAEEVARGIPTSIVAASDSIESAEKVQNIISGDTMRIYTSSDIIGAELGGALKNVIAVAAGFCDGLGLGDNSKAALITRGLAEMSRLGVCMGAEVMTFSGLTGIGDLVVTCTSQHSRNNRFGYKIGKGVNIKQALSEVGTVEGYYAAEMAYKLSKKYNIELPIISQCYQVLYENKDIKSAVYELMTRPIGKEIKC